VSAYVPAPSGARITTADKRGANLARALCRHGYRGNYWFKPCNHRKFLLLNAAKFSASFRWGRKGKTTKYWRTVGESLQLHEAVKIAKQSRP